MVRCPPGSRAATSTDTTTAAAVLRLDRQRRRSRRAPVTPTIWLPSKLVSAPQRRRGAGRLVSETLCTHRSVDAVSPVATSRSTTSCAAGCPPLLVAEGSRSRRDREHAVEHVHGEVDGPFEVDADPAELGVGVARRHAGGGRKVPVEVEHALGHHLRGCRGPPARRRPTRESRPPDRRGLRQAGVPRAWAEPSPRDS